MTKSIGICFLNDLMYLLRLPDYYRFLQQPVVYFIKELYGEINTGTENDFFLDDASTTTGTANKSNVEKKTS